MTELFALLRAQSPANGGRRLRGATAPPRGVTFVEIAVSTALVGVVLVGSLETVGMVYRTRRLNVSRAVGPDLALDLMSEILAMPYEDPELPGGGIGRESGESGGDRKDCDDVDDYHGWNASSAEDKVGASYPGFVGWGRQVQVRYVDPVDPAVTRGSDTGLKRIDVTVTPPAGNPIVLSALRGRHGPLEQAPSTDMTAVNWIGVLLQAGDATAPLRVGAPPANQSHDAN